MKELFRILRLARPYWLALSGSVVLMALAGAANGTMPLLTKDVFDFVLRPDAPDAPIRLLTIPIIHRTIYLNEFFPAWIHNVSTMVMLALISVFLVKGLADYVGNYLVNRVGYSAITDLRQKVFDRVLMQDATFFESHSTGHVMSSVMNDVDRIQLATSQMLADWLRQSFTVVALLVVVLQTDWKLAAVSLSVLPFVLVPTVRIGRRIRRTTRKAQDCTAELNQILQEAVSGHQVVRSFGAEEIESNRFRAAAARLKKNNLRYTLQQAASSPLIELFAVLTIVALVKYGRTQIIAGTMSTGDFVAFIIALLLLYEPVKRLTGIHNIFQQALGASQKVFEYIDQDQAVRDRPGATRLTRLDKGIRFEKAVFRYPNAPNGFALNGVDIWVPAGKVLALVGPSGAGKTTLANLVPRFYDVTDGAIRIDGRDIRGLKLASLRAKIGIVAQETFLFNDTVAANIGYGRPKASLEEIHEAARNAMAEEFILKLPEGYNAMIGERGTKLSGGQRQRIAIARALLKNAPILILDEATSHLDSESEVLVQHALANLMANRTVIVIAHRLSTIRRADQIVVLDRGSVVETGTHDELIVSGGLYQRLHELQFLEVPGPLVNP